MVKIGYVFHSTGSLSSSVSSNNSAIFSSSCWLKPDSGTSEIALPLAEESDVVSKVVSSASEGSRAAASSVRRDALAQTSLVDRAGAFSRRSVLRRCFRRAIFARTRAGEQLDCSGCIVNSLLTETVDDHTFVALWGLPSDISGPI